MTNDKLKQFELLMNDFNMLKHKEPVEDKDKLIRYGKLLEEFKKLKTETLKVRKEELNLLLNDESNLHKLRLSTFELMEYKWKENTHSNVLQYLFNYKWIKGGEIILSDFIKNIDGLENSEKLSQIILTKNYEIIREHSTDERKRIDLLILDKQNEMVIVIENKILSDVAERDSDDELFEERKTQLDDYRKDIEKKYPTFQKAFILLSFKEIERDYPPYKICDYKYLFEILHEVKIDNNILSEYELLLHSLVNGYNKQEIIEHVDNIDQINNLTTLQQLKQLFNEN